MKKISQPKAIKNKQEKPTSFWTAIWFIFKVSVISFGGGNAIFPIIKNQAVDKYKWMTDAEIEDIIVITNSIPGPSVVEAMSYICIKILASKWKGLIATFIGLLPHVLVFFGLFVLGTSFVPTRYLNIVYIAVIPVIIVMLFDMSLRYFKNANTELSYPVFTAYFLLSLAFNIFIPSPYNIPIILICAAIVFAILFEIWKVHHFKKHPPQYVACPKIKSDLNAKDIQYKKMYKSAKKQHLNQTWMLDVYEDIDLIDINKKYTISWSANGIMFRPKWGYAFKAADND